MKTRLKKCIISRYDETITEPPYLTIPLDNIKVDELENDEYGVEFAERLRIACRMKGYTFKSYSCSDKKDIDYEIIVY